MLLLKGMKKILIVFLLFHNVFFCQKQDKDIEVLIEKFESSLNTYPDSAYVFITKAKAISEKKNNDFLLTRCYYKLGYYFYVKNEISKSKYYLNKTILLGEISKNHKALASAYNQLGIIDMEKSDFNNSLKKLLKSLKIAEKNNLAVSQCSSLINLANLFEFQKDTTKAKNYYLRSIQISKRNGLKDYDMYGYSNLAFLIRNSEKEKSISYNKKVFAIAIELNDENQQFVSLINLSDGYLSFDTKASYDKAFKCLQRAEILAYKLKNKQNLFYVFFNFGGYYNKINDYKKAEDYYFKAKELSKSGIDNEQLLNLSRALELNYKSKGDFKNAYLYKEKHQKFKDSIFTIDKSKVFQDIQTKYEVEKKNLKINLLSKEKIIEKNNKLLVIYISIMLLIPLMLLLFFYRNRIKLQKIISQKENELFVQEKVKLQQEQELKRIIGHVEGQDIERNRIAKEIHDGIGGELAGIKLNLSQINDEIKNEKISTIIKQLATLFSELRNISHNLSSNLLKNKDFSKVLLELKREYEDRKEFVVEITIFPDNAFQTISINTKHQIFRIIQELLANVSKHANAKNVSIAITSYDEMINIIVEDDGKGFEENHKTGIGLKNIEERVMSLNGEITIDTKLNKGSSIIIDLPKL